MPRKPIGAVAMSAAERQRRRRERVSQAQAAFPPEKVFRHKLLEFVQVHRMLHPDLSLEELAYALEELALALQTDAYLESVGKVADNVAGYRAAHPDDPFGCLKSERAGAWERLSAHTHPSSQ